MVAPHSSADANQDQLIEILLEYTRAVERGERPDRLALLARYPELAPDLEAYFQGQKELAALTPSPGKSLPADKVETPQGVAAQDTIDSLLPLPRSCGGYEILGVIGHSGMGVVYRARQKNPNRVVALKMIRAGELATPAEVQRFRNEADAVAELDHPHIVPIYEAGAHEGQLYYSMKLIEGTNLCAHLAEQHARTSTGLPPRVAVDILLPIAEAVHHAHQRGILHRDLKPANILLSVQGPKSKIKRLNLGPWTLDLGLPT